MFIWRGCSGMAHVDLWASLSLPGGSNIRAGVGVGYIVKAKTEVPKTVVTTMAGSVRSTVALALRMYQHKAANHIAIWRVTCSLGPDQSLSKSRESRQGGEAYRRTHGGRGGVEARLPAAQSSTWENRCLASSIRASVTASSP
jgi:hypothetical protein